MDSIRPLLRISVVAISLALMVGYVWYSGGRMSQPASQPPAGSASVANPSSNPAAVTSGTAKPVMLLSGSKSYSGAIIGITSGDRTKNSTPTFTPSTQPILLHGSKSGILVLPIEVTPTTQPAPK